MGISELRTIITFQIKITNVKYIRPLLHIYITKMTHLAYTITQTWSSCMWYLYEQIPFQTLINCNHTRPFNDTNNLMV